MSWSPWACQKCSGATRKLPRPSLMVCASVLSLVRRLDIRRTPAQHPSIMKPALKARLLFLIVATSLFVSAQPPAAKEIKRPPIVGVSHIGLNVADLEATRMFYKLTLGFDEAYGQNNPDGSVKF